MNLVPLSLSLTEIEIDLASDLHARLHGPDVEVTAVSTDTRSITTGDLFIALRGPNHDGHQHLDAAIEGGASALLLEQRIDADIPQLVVSDTRLALGRIANLWCRRSAACRIGVTGSNGKTTVKEMLTAILQHHASRDSVHATFANFNNDIGLPLTCLGLRENHRYAVLEMGTNSKGEIGYLSDIACPDIALVTNVSAAHLEGFGSVRNIAHEKSQIYRGVPADGVAIVPADDGHLDDLLAGAGQLKIRSFGFTAAADVRGELPSEGSSDGTSGAGEFVVSFSENVGPAYSGQQATLRLALLGQHNRLNALAAIAAATAAGASIDSIVAGLESVQPVTGRLQIRTADCEARIIDDSYNANPASARAAIDVLAEFPGKRTLVLGDMLELGDGELEVHAEIGRYACEKGIDHLFTIGCLAAMASGEFGANGASYSDRKELALALRSGLANREHTFLFKGSRGARMEEVIEFLLDPELPQLVKTQDGESVEQSNGSGQSPGARLQRIVSL